MINLKESLNRSPLILKWVIIKMIFRDAIDNEDWRYV